MKKKAELLQTALKMMKRQLKGGGVELPDGSVGVMIDIDEALALVEALESLRWANMYSYSDPTKGRYIGTEHEKFESAFNAHRTAEFFPKMPKFETVGIIRLKPTEDEN